MTFDTAKQTVCSCTAPFLSPYDMGLQGISQTVSTAVIPYTSLLTHRTTRVQIYRQETLLKSVVDSQCQTSYYVYTGCSWGGATLDYHWFYLVSLWKELINQCTSFHNSPYKTRNDLWDTIMFKCNCDWEELWLCRLEDWEENATIILRLPLCDFIVTLY